MVFARLHRDEEGVALITAMIVSVVVLLLGVTSIQLAMHNSISSGYDRRRVQSIDAAEAGIDYFLSALQNTGGQPPPCSATRSMVGAPGSFTATATYYAVDGSSTPMACPLAPGAVPKAVRIRSVGTSTSAKPARTMEAYVKLSLAQAASFSLQGALFGQNNIDFASAASIGSTQSNNADVYTNGTISLASNSTIYGRVYSQGGVTLQSGAEVKRDVWANGNISLKSGARILGSASAVGSITLAANSLIQTGAKATGTITGGTVNGYRSPNTPVSAPPTQPFPVFTYTPADWSSAGYSIQTFSGPSACTSAEGYIRGTWSTGNLLVRVTEPGTTCAINFNSQSYPVKGNLAVISNGPINFLTGARFSASPSSSAFNVYMFGGLSNTSPCNMTFNPNSGFNPGLSTLLYVPSTCTIDMQSNSVISQGQIVGGTLLFKHTATFLYKPVDIPGAGIGGFKEDVSYKREIVS